MTVMVLMLNAATSLDRTFVVAVYLVSCDYCKKGTRLHTIEGSFRSSIRTHGGISVNSRARAQVDNKTEFA